MSELVKGKLRSPNLYRTDTSAQVTGGRTRGCVAQLLTSATRRDLVYVVARAERDVLSDKVQGYK